MKILCITHADFETPGKICDWAFSRKHTLSITAPYRGDNLPSLDSFDTLIIMGGPQSVNRLDKFPYLQVEIDFIKCVVAQNKPILGFCLGAQLLGRVFGELAQKSPEKEIGVFPISLTAEAGLDKLFSSFPQEFPAIHWHGEMMGLPKQAIVLATSAGCPLQIVKFADNIYAFQCHMEITTQGLKDLITNCPEDLAPSQFTQSTEQLLATNLTPIHQTLYSFLDNFYV